MVLDKAHELGEALSSSPEFTEMLRLRSELDSDLALQQAITKFSDSQKALMGLMEDENADQDEVSRLSENLQLLQGELMANTLFNAMLLAQNAFEELMRKVNGIIGSYIGAGDCDDDDCDGSCCSGGCEGCKH